MTETLISQDEIIQELRKRMYKYSNVLIWSLLFIYPLFSIVDFLFLEEYWKQVFQVRLIVVVLIYGMYYITFKYNWHPNLPLYVAFTLVSIQSAIVLTLTEAEDMRIYFLLYAAVFISFNSIALWKQWTAFLQYICSLFFIWVGFQFITSNMIPANDLLNNGGYMFAISAFFSCIIPGIRYKGTIDGIHQQILLQRSLEQLRVQNDEMRVQRTNIEKFTQQKNDMLRIAKHDLKNTSSAIYSLTSFTLEEFDKEINREETKEALQMSNEAARKMIYLIDQLLVPFDYKDSKIHFNYETVEFVKEIKHTIHGLLPLAESKNLSLLEDYSSEKIFIKADAIYFSIIIRNLVNYAIRLSDNNNQLYLISGRLYNRAFFEIVDKNRGIDKQELDEMFNKMQEINETTDVHDASQGIGLSVARLLTQNMGGKLDYTSSRELGLQFRIEFNVF